MISSRSVASTAHLGLALLMAFLVGACSGAWKRQDRSPASSLWINASSSALTPSTAARLKDAGVEEILVPGAKLDVDSATVLQPLELPALGNAMPLILSIEGEFGISDEERAEALAELVAEAGRQLRFDVESRGELVIGLHFDIGHVESLATYGAFLRAVNKSIDDDLLLSSSVDRDWLGREDLADVTNAVDFVIAFVYGQRIEETESAAAWDLAEMEQSLRQLEALKVPYQVGTVLLGTAAHIGKDGRVKARTTRRSLLDIMGNRAMKLRPGFTLEGANRQVYAVEAQRATTVGNWKVAVGESIRVVRPSTSDIEELLRLLDLWQLPHHLGQAYYRLAGDQEQLSVHSDSLLNALDAQPASPQLEVQASVQRRTGRGWLLRVGIENGNREFTELATLDNNYIELYAPDARFSSSNVAVGDFYRYELLRRKGGKDVKDFRKANVVRLFLPILEGQQRVRSGDLELIGRAAPRLEISARFLLPDGRLLEVGPRSWQDGAFTDETRIDP